MGLLLGFCNDFGLNMHAANGFEKGTDTGDFAKEKPVGLDVERWARSKNHGEDLSAGTWDC